MLLLRRLILLLPLLLLSLLHAGADDAWPKWAHEQSDIPVSPRITFGRLENGLRYALLPNRTPPGQVSLRLLVLAGSLNERSDELGYAHFVEHMGFRSTRNFPADEKVKFLQGLGVGFGPHVNAETTFTHTLYKLDLPENSAATLDSGLRILRDFADGLVFDGTETDRERGVVLSEALGGTKVGSIFAQLYDGTILPERLPIGTESSIKKARPAGLQSFFDAWYRPENMVVVIVGDIDAAKLGPLVRAAFGPLSARTPPRPAPRLGALTVPAKPVAKFFSETRNGVQVELGTIRLEALLPDNRQNRVRALQLEAANRMLRRRLGSMMNHADHKISGFIVDESFPYGRFHQLTITTAGDVYKWPTVLAKGEQELRRALEHGFADSELEAEQLNFRTEVQAETRLAVSAPTDSLANALTAQIEDNRVFTFPDERLAPVMAAIDALTVEDCRSALREAWGDSPRYTFITASRQLISATDKQIRFKIQESRDVVVAPPAAVQSVKFAYDDFGPPGEVLSKEHIADLDFWQVRFANGVRLNLKPTDFEHQRIRLALRIGSGRLAEPVNQPGLSLWAGAAAYFGGLRRHTDDELVRALNGTHVDLNFSAGNDAFEISAVAEVGELLLALRYVTAYVTDAAFRPEGGTRLTGNLNDAYITLEQSANGVIAEQILPFLAGGDTRLGFSSRKTVQGYSLEAMGAWLRPILQSGAMEVSLVGDFDVDQVIAEVAKTFGALPAREPKPDYTSRLKLAFPVPPQSRKFSYRTGAKNRPVTLALYWPVNEPGALVEKNRLQLLSVILQDRLRVQIRVEKGETYAPAAQFEYNDTYPGYANLHCQVEVNASRVKKLTGVVAEVALALGKQGVTAEELARAKAVCLADAHRWQRDNGYWISGVLADAQEHPWRLETARALEHEFATATVEEINGLATRFLTEKNLFQFTITPEYQRP